MNIIVQKFGGTSVENIERIKRVAHIIANNSSKVIVVVSAMAGMTNQLVKYTNDIHAATNIKELSEYDTVISAGEQITIGLTCLALMSLGLKAKSYLGWQVPITTTSEFSQAKISSICTQNLINDLQEGIIPVIAGFQGHHKHRITTLGRGGSDTTAVAIAVAVNAMRCDIYTDVNGIFTADPRIVPKAQKLNEINYEAALEMASCGAKVIHPRAVEIAMNADLPIRILNTFSNNIGTQISSQSIIMEKTIINGIAIKRNLIMITFLQLPVTKINQLLNELIIATLPIEFTSQFNVYSAGSQTVCDYCICISNEFYERFYKLYEDTFKSEHKIVIRNHLSKITIIGIGIKNDNKILTKILETLNTTIIVAMNILETQISIIVEESYTESILRGLHTNLGLDI